MALPLLLPLLLMLPATATAGEPASDPDPAQQEPMRPLTPAQPVQQESMQKLTPAQPAIPFPAPEESAPVVVAPFRGVVGPALVQWLTDALEQATELGAQLLILEIDTPGGLDVSSREIVQLIISAPLPVAVYVAPSGARAASAGTYILYSAHIAAMAPATSIGAATPVLLDGPGQQPPKLPLPTPPSMPSPADSDDLAESHSEGEGQDEEEADMATAAGEDAAQSQEPSQDQRTTLERKAENDAAAHIRGLALLRGRNAEWAESAVREAVSASASEALELGAIDQIAQSRRDLLAAVQGLELKLGDGRLIELDTERADLIEIEPGFRIALLSQLASPEVASLLLGLGLSLIPLEFLAGTGGIAAVVGLLLILLGAYGLSLLPLAYSGFAMVFIGLLLVIFDFMLGTAGVLALLGLVPISVGAFLIYDLEMDYGNLSLTGPWLIGGALLLAMVLLLLTLVVTRRQRTRSGAELMIGKTVEALADFNKNGWVSVGAERWRASIDGGAKAGERLYVVGRKNLVLLLSREPPESEQGNAQK